MKTLSDIMLDSMFKAALEAAGTGLGAKGQGIAAPVQPVSLDGNSGLGFQFPPPMFDRRPILRRRSSPPRRCHTAG